MRLKHIIENRSKLYNILLRLRPQLAASAQIIYDGWAPGDDDEFSGGGICDAISNAFGEVLSNFNIDYTEGGYDGDDHSYLIAYNDQEAYVVDIPPEVYESGGGYNWSKIHDVQFSTEDVVIAPTDRPDWVDDENY